ncbi:unnamed protein product [Meloidogyne enterolobii]|uniref:Uncharacterized protein n=1 Tax=Meloidogyne enterolobii TaxID=390850 RepID=A0ACB0ZAT4_MELEN
MKEKQNSKIIKHFTNIASLKRFRMKLFSKLRKMRNSVDNYHDARIKWGKEKEKVCDFNFFNLLGRVRLESIFSFFPNMKLRWEVGKVS